MDLILLPGNSRQNKEWIEIVSEYLRDDFHKCTILYYEHWNNPGQQLIDLNKETLRLIGVVKDRKDYVIFAKSAGIIVALRAISLGITPMKCVFAGTPLLWVRSIQIDINKLLSSSVKTPLIFIQNKNDPAAGSEELRNLLRTINFQPAKLIELLGNTHDYLDIIALKNEIVF